MTKRFLTLGLLVFLSLLALPLPISAHTPGPMILDYNADTDTLTVTVTHVVSTTEHYIASLQVWKNDVPVETKTYTSQESNSGMDDTFTIDAVNGDVLKATATCSISGFVTQEITVTIGTTATSETTTETPGTSYTPPLDSMLLYVAIAAAGVIVVVLVICLRKR
ncbi:MAG: hypothetical protein ACFFED_10160 [Candidatus Thorarchaeota archaeon]